MNGAEPRGDVEQLGRIEILPGANRKNRNPQIAEELIYRWLPEPPLLEDVPPGYSLDFRCSVTNEGRCFIAPMRGAAELLHTAFLGGLALLIRRHQPDSEQRYAYRAMRLMFHLVRGMREHLTREFRYSRDLYVRQRGRESNDERSVLPPDLGLPPAGEGRPWNISRLMERGEEAAQEMGCPRPKSEEKIQFGLFEAAQLNPLEVADEDVEGLVRAALFSGGPLDLNQANPDWRF